MTASQAQQLLTQALADLPSAAKSAKPAAPPPEQLHLAVEGLIDNQMTPRPHLPLHGTLTGPNLPGTRLAAFAAAGPLPALTLDPLTGLPKITGTHGLGRQRFCSSGG